MLPQEVMGDKVKSDPRPRGALRARRAQLIPTAAAVSYLTSACDIERACRPQGKQGKASEVYKRHYVVAKAQKIDTPQVRSRSLTRGRDRSSSTGPHISLYR